MKKEMTESEFDKEVSEGKARLIGSGRSKGFDTEFYRVSSGDVYMISIDPVSTWSNGPYLIDEPLDDAGIIKHFGLK